ncbi:MFS transporter [Pseudomonas japonica]|uniref:MFS transporter n=1 Tax=Pseudomonas japonica TaxID=256466 RepID=UPI0015E2BF7B|nr:MFS transporter [Pseudomonas japonica]MBA1290588.1 MFS transporter [Pseudomonas japonica]
MPALSLSRRRHATLIGALGCNQILAWGSTFYLPAVLAVPIAQSLNVSVPAVVGALSWALLVAGVCAPLVGRTIDRFGGKGVLAGSAVLLALGLTAMSFACGLIAYYAAWTVLGLGMAAGLYDAGFATLGRLMGSRARSSITGLTLIAGFASTVAWPFLAAMEANQGWPATCRVLAIIHLLVGLPLHLVTVPSPAPRPPAAATAIHATDAQAGPQLAWIAVLFTLHAFVMSALAVNLLVILQGQGIPAALAVTLGALMGPSQVVARVLEYVFGRQAHPVWIARLGMLACIAGLLGLGPGLVTLSLLAVVAFGGGNGIMTIARGTVPLTLLGSAKLGSHLGLIARPVLIAQAAAPLACAYLLEQLGPRGLIGILAGLLGLGAVVAFARLRAFEPTQV